MPIGAPSGHDLRSRVGQGAELSGFWPPWAALTSAVQGGEAEPQAQCCLPAARHAGLGQPSRFLPKSRFLPASTGAGSGSGWGGTIAGCGGREMPKGGKVTMNTNISAILWQWECPATVAPAALGDSGVGDTSG